jgi:hypothetical protein
VQHIPYGVHLMSSSLRDRVALHRDTALVVVAGLAVVGYAALTPPAAGPEVFAWFPHLVTLEGDLPQYLWRFMMSLLLLGVVPFGAALILGERPRDLGLAVPRKVGPTWAWVLMAVGSVASAAIGAHDPAMARYYPYSKTLLQLIAHRGLGPFWLHALLYVVMYYIPWEIFFRGLLLFPVVRLGGDAAPSVLICLASLQAIPSGLLHIGHPAVESLGSVLFGVGAGYVALRSGSILPGLAVHAGIGVLQDLFLALRHTGVLP